MSKQNTRYTEESALDPYAKYALKHKILTRAQEAEIGARILEGDKAAVDELVVANLRFVASIASRILWTGLTLQQRVSSGNRGLITAAEKFDHTKGFKFVSYAVWWIKQAITRDAIVGIHPVNLRGNTSRDYFVSRKILDRHFQKKHREMDAEELAPYLDGSMARATAVMVMIGGHKSLDEQIIAGGKSMTRKETLVSREDRTDFAAEQSSTVKALDKALVALPARTQDMIRMRYGVQPYDREHILGECGVKYGVTKERARQIIDEGMENAGRPGRNFDFLKANKGVVKEAKRAGIIILTKEERKNEKTRQCKGACGETKPVRLFARNRNGGFGHICKECDPPESNEENLRKKLISREGAAKKRAVIREQKIKQGMVS